MPDYEKLGKCLGRVLVERNDEMWLNIPYQAFISREDQLRSIARRLGEKFKALLLFENGRERL